MTYIYSDKKIDKDGQYRSPRFFSGVDSKANLVYTDNENILNAYRNVGVEVKPIKAKKKTAQVNDNLLG